MSKNKLFHWPCSGALKNYVGGDIIVMATDQEEARDKVLANALDYAREHKCWLFNQDGSVYPDEAEAYAAWLATLVNDLKEPPRVVETGVVMIEGSE